MTTLPFESRPSVPRAAAAFALLLGFVLTSYSQQKSYVGLDFGDLMKVKVSTVERREKAIGQTPAAVFVLTAEDIRRSGATNLPDALRGVPGLTVARATGNTWAISSRGGLDPLANRMLVLIDGRSVYNPLFAGVHWDIQDIPLETIERIEIISGPGGSVYGANAVNGVINVIRKPAADQAGTLASVSAGDEERFIGNVTTGWTASRNVKAAAYGRYREFDGLRKPGGGDAGDEGHQGGGGFRVDARPASDVRLTVSGDAYSGQFYESNETVSLSPPSDTIRLAQTNADGGNLLTRLHRDFGVAGAVLLQVYFDRTRRLVPGRYREVRHTWDGLAQHQITLARVHRVTWGAGFRTTKDRIDNTTAIRFDPDAKRDDISNVFAQDEMQLLPSWSVNLGGKYERNDYTGWEFQPSARTAWEVARDHVLWAAVSRSVRTPSRIDRDLRSESLLSPAPLFTASIRGTDDFVSERLTAYELGYRAQPTRRIYWSLATFYNRYDRLRGATARTPFVETDPAPSHLVLPFFIENNIWAESYGGEIAPRVQLADWWQIRGSYSLLHQRYHNASSEPELLLSRELADPVHQASLRSSWDVGRSVELDAGLRWVDELQNTGVDDYTALDLRAAWKLSPALTLEAVGQNVLQPYHREFSPGNEVERSVYGKATYRFL